MGVQAGSKQGARSLGAGLCRGRRRSAGFPCRRALLGLTLAAVLLSGVASASAATTGPPSNRAIPAIGGKAVDEAALSATAGHWAGTLPLTYSYQWELCNEAGEECANIAGATSHKYKLQHADVGNTLRAVVTATNSEGSSSAISKHTAVIAPSKPARNKAPVITGAAVDGQLLSSSTGVWRGTPPLTLGYQWNVCERTVCTAISGASGSTYRATTSEVGKQLRVVVTATNGVGSASSTSLPSKK